MSDVFKSTPLQQFRLQQIGSIDDVHAAIAEILVPHKIAVSGYKPTNREPVVHHARLPGCELLYLVYGTELRIDVAQLGFFLLEIPLSGSSTTYCGDGSVLSGPGQAVVAGPYQQFATEWTIDCSKLLIKIESNILENYLSTLLGRRQIRALDFQMDMDVTTASAAALLRTVEWILTELDRPDSLVNNTPHAGYQYQQMLMWSLLHSQPNNYSEELAALQQPRVPHYITETEAYIQKHYAEAINLEHLVENARVSERTLLDSFKRYRDISPMKLLKLVRLDFVHLALKEADPEDSNVTEIALSNGFTQLGKFSTEYKKRFGESPSDTLKLSGL